MSAKLKHNYFIVVLLVLISVSFFQFLPSQSAYAQELPGGVDSGTPPDGSEDTDTDTVDEDTQDTSAGLTEENTQSFITGVGVGATIGIIIGGVLAWTLKRKVVNG